MRVNRATRLHRTRAHVIMRSLGDNTSDSGGGSPAPENAYITEAGEPYVTEAGVPNYYVTET